MTKYASLAVKVAATAGFAANALTTANAAPADPYKNMGESTTCVLAMFEKGSEAYCGFQGTRPSFGNNKDGSSFADTVEGRAQGMRKLFQAKDGALVCMSVDVQPDSIQKGGPTQQKALAGLSAAHIRDCGPGDNIPAAVVRKAANGLASFRQSLIARGFNP